MAEEQPKKWWETVPGILTGISGIIVAIGGLIVVLKPSDTEITSPNPVVLYNSRVSARCGADTDGDLQSCDTPFEVQVNNPYKGLLEVEYKVPNGHCSSIQVTLDLDGQNIGTSEFLGWNSNPSFGPLSKIFYTSNVDKGTHKLELFGNGFESGCNKGRFNSFGGNLKVTLRPE